MVCEKEPRDPVNLEQIKKKFRELGIPEDHVDHVKKCESCYNLLIKNIKES